MLTRTHARLTRIPTPMAALALGIASLGWCWENALPLDGHAKQLGALHDKALAGGEPRGDEDAVAVERFDPHRARLETFCGDMLVDDVLAAGIAY
mgnify:CR=1 FL=1